MRLTRVSLVPTLKRLVRVATMANPDAVENALYSVIAKTPSVKQADEWRFVLRTQNIEADVVRLPEGEFGLRVVRSVAGEAMQKLALYEQENRTPPPQHKTKLLYRPTAWSLALVVALVAFFFFTGPAASPLRPRYFEVGTATARELLHRAPWQAITALTLHADFMHLSGNAVMGAVFFSAVHRRLGPGLGTFAMVVAGALGNVANAVHHASVGHRSIGASTAVLAAIGILTALQVAENRTLHARRHALLHSLGPVFGGAALLGFIGSHPSSDLLAHLYGFLAGCVVGALAAFALRDRSMPLSDDVQGVFGFGAFVLIAGAWTLALRV